SAVSGEASVAVIGPLTSPASQPLPTPHHARRSPEAIHRLACLSPPLYPPRVYAEEVPPCLPPQRIPTSKPTTGWTHPHPRRDTGPRATTAMPATTRRCSVGASG